MKAKLLLCIILISASFTICNAQIKKGTVSLGGDLSFYTSKRSTDRPSTSEMKQNNLYLAPAIGKAVKDNLFLGITLLYKHTFYEPNSGFPAKSIGNAFGGGVFLRRYLTLGKGFYLFAQGNADVSYEKTKDRSLSQNDPYKSDTKNFGARVAFYPGVSYAINKKFQVEAGFRDLAYVNYNHSIQDETQPPSLTPLKTTNNNFSINTSVGTLTSFTLGFRVFFPG